MRSIGEKGTGMVIGISSANDAAKYGGFHGGLNVLAFPIMFLVTWLSR